MSWKDWNTEMAALNLKETPDSITKDHFLSFFFKFLCFVEAYDTPSEQKSIMTYISCLKPQLLGLFEIQVLPWSPEVKEELGCSQSLGERLLPDSPLQV